MAESSSPVVPRTMSGRRAVPDRIAVQEFHLVLMNTHRAGTIFAVTAPTIKVGKAADNDLVLDDPTVSRNHLLIQRQGDRFLIQDLGSTNDTFIDAAQVREAYLRSGAVLEVGDVKLRFQTEISAVEIAPTSEGKAADMTRQSAALRPVYRMTY